MILLRHRSCLALRSNFSKKHSTGYSVQTRFSKAFSRRALMRASGRGAEKTPRGVRKKTKHMIGVRHLLGFISRYVMFSPLLHLFIPSLFNLSLSSSLHLFISPEPLLLLFSAESNPCSSSSQPKTTLAPPLCCLNFYSLYLSAESNPCSSSSQPRATPAPPLSFFFFFLLISHPVTRKQPASLHP